ncbi:MAG: M28 family peptidase [Armatimonadetes bacterium]|nr:M28 family peptidase [Armatimonadota bacterium]
MFTLRFSFLIFFLFLSFNLSFAEPKFNNESAYLFLEKICDFGSRYCGTITHKKTGDFILEKLNQYCNEVIVQRFYLPDYKINFTNFIGIFNPKNPKKILIGAHWDTPKAKFGINKEEFILGANDGGSGTAALLELARNLSFKKPALGVYLVFFDGEDFGNSSNELCLGSKYFVKNLKEKFEYGIIIDMIGGKNLKIFIEGNSYIYAPWLVKKIWGEAKNLNYLNFSDKIKYYVYDDHLPLIKQGIPTILLIDLDYPPWHTKDDTLDKCSKDSLGIIGNLLLKVIFK